MLVTTITTAFSWDAGIAKGESHTITTKDAQTDTAKHYLRKTEFGVEDAVCVVCLREILNTLRLSKGVLRAEPSMKFAYGFAVIYDKRTISQATLLAPIKKKYTLFDITDMPVTQLR